MKPGRIRHGWRDIPAFLRVPVGRQKLYQLAWHGTWPLFRPVAGFYRRTLARHCRLVAVVGSFGKTTTARAVARALGRTVGHRVGANGLNSLAWAVLRIRPGDRHAVTEAGIDRVGRMATYAEMMRPDITVVTSIGSEHNRSFGTLEVTRSEKSHMVQILPASGIAVLNGDDPNVLWMAGKTRARVITFGLGEGNEIRASDVALDWPHGTRFRLHADGRAVDLHIRLLGRHMVRPILAAVAVALAEGFPLEEVLPSLEALPPTPGRMQPVDLGDRTYLLRDEFKSALETMEVALDTLAEIPARQRIVVFGDVSEPPGSQGPIYRALGKRIAEIASQAIFVGEGFQSYSVGARRAGMARSALFSAGRSVLRATEELQASLGPGDVALIKGRDTQRLERIPLALQGRPVRCDISLCRARALPCSRCAMLERGWDGRRVAT